MTALPEIARHVTWTPRLTCSGTLCAVRSGLAFARIPLAAIGDLCFIERRSLPPLPAQIISFNEELCSLAPFDTLAEVTPGAVVTSSGAQPAVHMVGDPRGRILDALGLDLQTIPQTNAVVESLALDRQPPSLLGRQTISKQLVTGVKSIDFFCPLGVGQRIGLFSAAGVGKSTLLGTIARHAAVDISVIALVGERGREVKEFIDSALGPEGLAKSVLVVATSDESPVRRLFAPKTATAIAEWYRDQGLNVLLLVDSLTRTARAIREIELVSGSIPVRQGYTAGVYTELPRLLERSGTSENGSITAVYSILISGTDEPDPLAEEMKSILDGHLVLDARLAAEGLRPAIDPLASISRLLERLLPADTLKIRDRLIAIISRLRRDRDLVLLGGQADAELKAALALEPRLKGFLSQHPHEHFDPSSVLDQAMTFLKSFDAQLDS